MTRSTAELTLVWQKHGNTFIINGTAWLNEMLKTWGMDTLREATEATESASAKGVRCSSATNWLSWEWVRLQK